MEKIVVTGTRSSLSVQNSPVAVEVITAEQLQLVGQGTLANALNLIPGIVTRRNVKDGYVVQMQGFDADHVLILLDGQPLISPTGAAVDLDQIALLDIARIEVMRGAASVLYGSSAMGGVVNIITRNQRSNHLKLAVQSASYLNNSMESDQLAKQWQLDVSQQILGWQTKLSVQDISGPGFDYDTSTLAQSAPSTDKSFINLGLSRNFDDLQLSFNSRVFNDSKHKQRYAVPGQSSRISYLSDVKQWQQDVSISQPQWWKVQGRYVRHQETSGDSNGLRDADIQLAEIDSQYQWTLAGADVVSGAVLHRDELFQQKLPLTASETGTVEIDNQTRDSVEVFSQMSWQLSAHQLLAGIRAQHDSDFGWHSAARLNMLVALDEHDNRAWKLRAGLGQSYRVPSLKERFYVFDHSNLGYMVLGNADLQPETAISSNLELSYYRSISVRQDLSLSANLHYARTKDFIATLTDVEASAASGLLVSRYFNVDQAYIKGVDLNAKVQGQLFDYQLSYSYLHAINHQQQHLSDRPTHQIKANLNWHLPHEIEALAYLVYESGTHPSAEQVGVARDHWLSLNFSVSQQLNAQWRWQAGVDNVFDNHQDSQAIAAGLLDVRPLASRRLFVGLSYQFY